MNVRLARLIIVAVIAGGAAGSLVGSGEARACSCNDSTALDHITRAEVIVSGAPIEQYSDVESDGEDLIVWRFEVDERWRGDTPPVIELQARANESSCGAPPVIAASILMLAWRRDNGRYDVSAGCGSPFVERSVLDRVFTPPPLDGEGAVRVVAAADAEGRRLALLDERGRVLEYLPSKLPTWGLALCPSGERFIQLRPTSVDDSGSADSFELATWQLDGWVEIAMVPVTPVDPWSEPPTLMCETADAREARIIWSEYSGETTVVDGVVTQVPGPDTDPYLFTFRIDGLDGSTLLLNGNGSAIVLADGTQTYLETTNVAGGRESPSLRDTWSILAVDDGWIGTTRRWVEIEGQYGAQALHIGLDSQVTTSTPIVFDVTLGRPVGLIVPDGAPSAPATEPPAALFARSGSEIEAPVTLPSIAPETDGTDPGADVDARATEAAVDIPTATTGPDDAAASTEAPPIEASVETRTVRIDRVAGLGALVVLALLGAFGLRQLMRARMSD